MVGLLAHLGGGQAWAEGFGAATDIGRQRFERVVEAVQRLIVARRAGEQRDERGFHGHATRCIGESAAGSAVAMIFMMRNSGLAGYLRGGTLTLAPLVAS